MTKVYQIMLGMSQPVNTVTGNMFFHDKSIPDNTGYDSTSEQFDWEHVLP